MHSSGSVDVGNVSLTTLHLADCGLTDVSSITTPYVLSCLEEVVFCCLVVWLPAALVSCLVLVVLCLVFFVTALLSRLVLCVSCECNV
jgi:hypothetical protein